MTNTPSQSTSSSSDSPFTLSPSFVPQFHYPDRLLVGPGPSNVDPIVLSTMSRPLLGHLDPDFLHLMSMTQDMLRHLYRTDYPLTIPISATGMAGMECCFVNLIEPGDTVIVCCNGFFSQRMVDIATRAGAKVITFQRPWGEVFEENDLNAIEEILKKEKPKALGIVHAETSTGACQPLDRLGKLCHQYGTLLIVDAVTSLGCIPLEVKKWEIDAVYSCSQKGLSCPPGLSPVSFSPRAEEVMAGRKTKVQSWYLDLTMIRQYWNSDRAYHHTAPITMIFALFEGLRLIFTQGLENRWEMHQKNHLALKAGLEAIGLEYQANPKYQLPQLNVVKIPIGIEDLKFRKTLLNEYRMEIGGGLGEFKGKVWRIGLMGCNSNPAIVSKILSNMEQCLISQGKAIPK